MIVVIIMIVIIFKRVIKNALYKSRYIGYNAATYNTYTHNTYDTYIQYIRDG